MRLIPEVHAAQNRVKGLGSDAELALSWLKGLFPRNSAGSLKLDHFTLDQICASFFVGAIV